MLTTTTATATDSADLFFKHVFCDHGLLLDIISDRGPQFAGKFSKALAARLGMQRKLATAFHTQTDGQSNA